MSMKINPSLNQEVRESFARMLPVAAVKSLPTASAEFEGAVYIPQTDGRMYRCVKIDDNWVWQALTIPVEHVDVVKQLLERILAGEGAGGSDAALRTEFENFVKKYTREAASFASSQDVFNLAKRIGTVEAACGCGAENHVSADQLTKIGRIFQKIANIEVSETFNAQTLVGAIRDIAKAAKDFVGVDYAPSTEAVSQAFTAMANINIPDVYSAADISQALAAIKSAAAIGSTLTKPLEEE